MRPDLLPDKTDTLSRLLAAGALSASAGGDFFPLGGNVISPTLRKIVCALRSPGPTKRGPNVLTTPAEARKVLRETLKFLAGL